MPKIDNVQVETVQKTASLEKRPSLNVEKQHGTEQKLQQDMANEVSCRSESIRTDSITDSGISLPDCIHDTPTEQQRMDKMDKVQQSRELKDFYHIGDVAENRFSVTLKLKHGGFGQVYKVVDNKTTTEAALKVEKVTGKSAKTSDEVWEGTILKEFQGHVNCPKLIAMGTTAAYTYIAMQLLGENLSDIRRSCPQKPARLSLSSACRTTMQCLRAIEGLHKIGYLHRDVKPSNFAVGREQCIRNVVYMLDFGLCRKFRAADGALLKPREKVGFRGTVRYASLAAHLNRDLGRRDDIWSLFYTFIELMTGSLPWHKTNDKEVVLRLKQKYSYELICKVFPSQIGDFRQSIDKLGFFDTPDYGKLCKYLTDFLHKLPGKMSDLYDWQLLGCVVVTHWSPPKPLK